MTPRTVPPLALAALALLWGVPALATEAPADAPTATAPATAPGELSVADQIAAYLRTSPVARLPTDDEPSGVTSSTPARKPHGVVDVAVGSHGYRSVYVRSDLPIGETGTLSIAVGETRGGRGFGYGYGYGPGPGYGYGAGLGVGRIDPRGLDCRNRVGVDPDRPCLRDRLGAPVDAEDGAPLPLEPSR